MLNVDVNETDDELQIVAELHSLTANDIDVSVERGVLTIIAERQVNDGRGAERTIRVLSSMLLPSSVDAHKINAYFDDGVMTVTFPKHR
ncbi:MULTISPECIES: Hsp20/alpha crystallin family protein [Bradyrhizobium]|uniref:HSP20 family protein n=1 Tax=Bradyrhizobium elkanii TaxID=29448 RepID=A0A8I1Y3D2_BRAEL|nr:MULTISPECIES: Hsp20/alpha crystallin family protein [Bradyrhizobium]MBP1291191.1 HSP20 family protein [Bradyrhizobium elkanii]MCP1928493.1 HSP20 family protein [Bradyrhizobium elkanii]MCP1973016.1 HSP20 family protein [Bradyrhizobium elkanii]MCS3580892.1 HSP20 family protein [Bradyrhizobium elkanii]MCS3723768.1 HSP20 family protein [Bradyrhizobium elkanii]